jgi:hypothetical protein
MRCTCRWLNQDCFQIWKVANGEYHSSWVPTVLGHPTGHITTISYDILAKLGLPAGTIKAVQTRLQSISGDTITNGNVLDVLADSDDSACCFMACDDKH